MRRLLFLIALAGVVCADDVRTMGRTCQTGVTREVTPLGNDTYRVELTGNISMTDALIKEASGETMDLISSTCPHAKYLRGREEVEIRLFGSFDGFNCSYEVKTPGEDFRGNVQYIADDSHILVCDIKPAYKVEGNLSYTNSSVNSTITSTLTQNEQATQENESTTTTTFNITPTTQEIITINRPMGVIEQIIYSLMHII